MGVLNSELAMWHAILIGLLGLLTAHQSIGLRCIGCTSDNGNNVKCEEEVAKNLTTYECRDEQHHCYVMVQKLKTSGDILVWNRNCCKARPGVSDCPTDKPSHEKTEYYEVWRKTATQWIPDTAREAKEESSLLREGPALKLSLD